MTESSESRTGRSMNVLKVYLIFTATICGALVMVIEVLGSRVIGPFFGVSLFVWTSLITVTMIALAAGYGLGGIVADRKGTPDYLYGIIMASGASVLLIPPLKNFVLQLCFPLGLRLGTFCTALILFGPSLFLLGCVSPFIVKIATRQLDRIGRVVGGFYALSTVGSVIGTVLTGFVLVAYLGVNTIFVIVGGLLILLAVIYFVFFRRKWVALVVLLVPVLVFAPKEETGISRMLDSGTRVTLVASVESHYGSLKVVDYTYQNKHTRELIIDGLVQGGVDMNSGLSIYDYSYFLQFIPYSLVPDGRNCLVIGLGWGAVPRWYEQQGIRTDVVDIDPNVEQYARTYFDFMTSGQIAIEDARFYLGHNNKIYDFMILDVFSGDTTPGYLLSKEAISRMGKRLSDQGVLGINMMGSLRKESFMTASVVRTLQTVFEQVEIHPLYDPEQGSGVGNLIIIAYSGPPRKMDLSRIEQFPVHPMAREAVLGNLNRTFEFPPETPAIVLTDDYNPLDSKDASVKEDVRMSILESTHWDILL